MGSASHPHPHQFPGVAVRDTASRSERSSRCSPAAHYLETVTVCQGKPWGCFPICCSISDTCRSCTWNSSALCASCRSLLVLAQVIKSPCAFVSLCKMRTWRYPPLGGHRGLMGLIHIKDVAQGPAQSRCSINSGLQFFSKAQPKSLFLQEALPDFPSLRWAQPLLPSLPTPQRLSYPDVCSLSQPDTSSPCLLGH